MRLTVLGATCSSLTKTDFPLCSTPVTTRLTFIAPPRLVSPSERRVPRRGARPRRLPWSGPHRAGGAGQARPLFGRGRGDGGGGPGPEAGPGLCGQARHPEGARVV